MPLTLLQICLLVSSLHSVNSSHFQSRTVFPVLEVSIMGSNRGIVIVVTGFGPFQRCTDNPSERLVRRLAVKGSKLQNTQSFLDMP